MPDPGFVLFADSLGSLSSLVFFVFIGASLLIFWQIAILVGTLIANLWHRKPHQETGPVELV